MSTARGFSPLDIMTLGDFRGANEAGDGLVVLAPALDSVLWANRAGRVLLGLSDDRPSLSPMSGLSRQIKATARLIETRGEARLLLRPATGLAAQPVVADLKRVETPEGVQVVVLAAAAGRPAADSLAALADRLLTESGQEDAAIYGRDGALVSGAAAPAVEGLPAEIAALIDSGLPQRIVDRADARLTLARVAQDLVLVRQDRLDAVAPELQPSAAPAATSADAPAPVASDAAAPAIPSNEPVADSRASESLEATSMSAIVRRWHSRGTPTGLAPAWRPAETRGRTDAEAGAASAGDGASILAADDAGAAPDGGTAAVAPEALATDAAQASTEPASDLPPAAESDEAADEIRADEAMPAPVESAAPPRRSAWGAPFAAPTSALQPGPVEAPDAGAPEQDSAAPATPPSDAVSAAPLEAPSGDDRPMPAVAAPMRPLRSVWGAPVEPVAPIVPELPGAGDSMPPEHALLTPDAEGGRDSAVPNDAPIWGDGESAPSVEKPTPALVPDTVPATPADIGDVIDEDAETPGEEDLFPGGEERTRPEGLLPEETPEPPAAEPTVAAPDAATLDAATLEADPASAPPLDAPALAVPEPSAAEPAAPRRPFTPSFEGAPVRFVWQIDRNGKFRSLTPEFSAAVGPQAADVAGRSFREVADVFGFDTSGEISRLLERRDTWSGRSILWPVEASARKVPVDLAALPVYARDRSFDGFRGFGIVRMNESVPDPDGIGLILADFAAFAPDLDDEPAPAEAPALQTPAPPAVPPEAGEAGTAASDEPAAASRPLLTTFEATPPAAFGRRPEPPLTPAESGEDEGPDADEPKVIRLEERRRPRDASLSLAEEAAFRAIGMTLGRDRAKAPRDERGTGPAQEPARPAETAEGAIPSHPTVPAEPLEDARAEARSEPTAAEIASSPARPADAATLPAPVQQHDMLPGTGLSQDGGALDGATTFAEGMAETAEPGETVMEPSELAGADVADGEDADETADDVGDEETAPLPATIAAEIEAIFGTLPLPILVQMNETLIYANREFQDLSGYGDIAALEAAGGLGTLFAEPAGAPRQGELAIRRSNGQIADVRVHMQRATFTGRSCLMMSFSPSPRESAVEAGVVPDRAEAAAETDLRQQIEELQAVLDTATDGIVLLDPAGIIRAMNGSAHALFGLGPDASTGLHLSSLFAPESQQATLDYLEMLREEGLAGILNDGREVVGQVAQGGPIPLFITIGRLSGERGWCVVIRDIAHWKRIEEDLVNARRQAEAASLHKSRFLANISHELRTPLNAIIGFADVMASECFGPIGNERYIEYLGDIKRSGHHVLDLVNDLLDISKIEAGKLDLAFEAVSLNEVISEVVSLMQPQANRERVIVRSNLPSSVPPVVADRRTMRQIALNLIANAIRFTPAGGQIIASTTYTADGEVLLRFRDSGIGMSEREIDIALTPFQQVHPPGATRGEGTGLGLPLTKAMVEANRANFAISSAPGEGTLVEIAFPSQRVLAD